MEKTVFELFMKDKRVGYEIHEWDLRVQSVRIFHASNMTLQDSDSWGDILTDATSIYIDHDNKRLMEPWELA